MKTLQQGVHRGDPAPIDYYVVSREEVERYYAGESACRAPLDPGELDSMQDRLEGRIHWEEPVRASQRERFITLAVPWQAAAAFLPTAMVIVKAGTYPVVDNYTDGPFVIRVDDVDLQLVHSWRGLS